MVVKMPIKNQNIFEINPTLLRIEQFSKFELEPRYMEVVALIADCQSPFALQEDPKKRELACMVCGFKEGGSLSKEGAKIQAKKNKNVETAIEAYDKFLNPQRAIMARRMLEAMRTQFNTLIEVLSHAESEFKKDEEGNLVMENGKPVKIPPEEYLKIQDQANKIHQQSIDRKVWASIQFYEKEAMHEYEVEEKNVEVFNNMKKPSSGESIADFLDD